MPILLFLPVVSPPRPVDLPTRVQRLRGLGGGARRGYLRTHVRRFRALGSTFVDLQSVCLFPFPVRQAGAQGERGAQPPVRGFGSLENLIGVAQQGAPVEAAHHVIKLHEVGTTRVLTW